MSEPDIDAVNLDLGVAYNALLSWLESEAFRAAVRELRHDGIERSVPDAAKCLQMPPECLAIWMLAVSAYFASNPDAVREAFEKASAKFEAVMKRRTN